MSSPLAVRVGPNDRVMTVLIQSGIAEAMTGVNLNHHLVYEFI